MQPSRIIPKVLSLKIRGGQPACGTSAPAPVGTLRKPQQRLQQRTIHIRHLFPRSHSRARGIASVITLAPLSARRLRPNTTSTHLFGRVLIACFRQL